ncbi:MAG: cytochrome c biogenesis protein CcdA, partial [Anaerolineae bacterium]|nr:cytochrome c biogenesis protein CcdA [Anaerolineae bacterium]
MSADTPTIGLAFIAGFLSFISPCVLPLVPAYIGYMGGRVTNTVSAQLALSDSSGTTIQNTYAKSRFSIVVHGLFFIAGFTIVFVVVGVITSALLGSARDTIGRIGGVIIIFFGLNFMGILPNLMTRLTKAGALLGNPMTSVMVAIGGTIFILWSFTGSLQPALSKTFETTAGSETTIEWPTIIAFIVLTMFLLWLVLDGAFSNPLPFWKKVIATIQHAFYADTRRQIAATGRQGFTGSALMGIVFAAGWTPCIGPILGSILGLSLSSTGNNLLSAASLLVAYSLGLGIPFLITAWMLDSVQGLLRRLQRYMHQIELIIGGFLVFIGVMVATGQLQSISQSATQRFSDFSVSVENCGVGFINGEITISHLGPCLSGETPLFKLGNTVQNQFETNSNAIQYIFRA